MLIPCHSSENRKYIPFGYFSKENIVHNSCLSIENATLYHFGVLSSIMHMVWINYIGGKLEGRFRYSAEMVYNNYPWPEKPSKENIKSVENKADEVIKIRSKFQNSLSELYDPLSMPRDLLKAHQDLDKCVDLCYRSQAFINERKRIEYLLDLYVEYTT